MSTTENVDRFRLRVQTSPYSIGAVKLMWEPQYGARAVTVHWSYGPTHETHRMGPYSREFFVPCLPDGAWCEFWLTAELADGETVCSERLAVEVENDLQRDVERLVAGGRL